MSGDLSEIELRSCFGTFATGVAVVTAEVPRGQFYGITINSFSSVSLNPPLVLFSLEKKALRFRAFMAAELFVVNILSEQQKNLSKIFAQNLPVLWPDIILANEYNLPILQSSLSYIYCAKEVLYEGGDHMIIVGRVIKAKKLADDGVNPLIYYRSNYRKIGDML